jgi:hypothetical protein
MSAVTTKAPNHMPILKVTLKEHFEFAVAGAHPASSATGTTGSPLGGKVANAGR